MAPGPSSVIHNIGSSLDHRAHHLNTLARRHMSADVTTKIIFGVLSGVIALVAILQVAIITRKRPVLHCRLLHREAAVDSSISTELTQMTTSTSPIDAVSNTSSERQPTRNLQQPGPESLRSRSHGVLSNSNSTSDDADRSTPIARRQTKAPKPRPDQILVAVLLETLHSLQTLNHESNTALPFIVDVSARQS
jgi:hypothetical protein